MRTYSVRKTIPRILESAVSKPSFIIPEDIFEMERRAWTYMRARPWLYIPVDWEKLRQIEPCIAGVLRHYFSEVFVLDLHVYGLVEPSPRPFADFMPGYALIVTTGGSVRVSEWETLNGSLQRLAGYDYVGPMREYVKRYT